MLPLAAFSQPPDANAPEISSRESPVTFSSRVNLVSVPVVVRDRAGRAVENLRQGNFQLYDKGKLQVITKFTVEKADVSAFASAAVSPAHSPATPSANTIAATAPPPVLPDRYVVFLVDDVQLSIDELARTRAAALRMVNGSFDPGTRAAIYTTSRQVTLDFTADRDKLAQAFNRIRPLPTLLDTQRDCPSISYYQAQRIVEFSDLEALQSGELDYLIRCAPPPGNKPVWVEMEMARPQVEVLARRALMVGREATLDDLNLLKDLVRRLTPMPGSRTIVLVSPGFFVTDDRRDEETDVMDRAIRANVVISSLDTRAIFDMTPLGNADVPRGVSDAVSIYQEFERKRAFIDEGIMQDLADGTGGTFFHNDNDLKAGLDRLTARPEYIYILGFSPQDLKYDGSFHTLKVKVANLRKLPNVTLQVRKGYWAPNHTGAAAEQAKDEIKEALFSRDEIHDVPVDVQTEFFKSSDEKAELTVTEHLDAGTLRFRKSADRNGDTVTVVTGLFDANGNYVAGIKRVVDLFLSDQTLATFRNLRITVEETFQLAPGSYIVRMVVRDAEGKTMAARNLGVEIP
jgi:VWFA-related protein